MGVDDLFTPEIGSAAKDVKAQEAYDDAKVQAILNEINGQDHTGKVSVGVPALFGMAFQVFRFAQVIPTGGYTDASGTPSVPLLDSIEHTDQSIGKMVSALKTRGLFDSTLIIITAKHGRAPIDRSKSRITDDTIIPSLVNQVRSGLVALSYSDGNITAIWLTDQSQTAKVAETLSLPANQSVAGIQKILWGESLKLVTNDPTQDIRVPDIVVIPNLGNIYAPADETEIAAHGGFSEEDTHVALLVSSSAIEPRMIKTPVETTQIAPTILQALGLDPKTLQAVRQEETGVLPGLFVGPRNRVRSLSSQ
jgi:arylsulfatase A-like enzyme